MERPDRRGTSSRAKSTEKELLEGDALPADAVLCPSHLLGALAERKLLAPVPPAILRGAQWGGIFELLKLREAAWGQQIMAVPFGSPVLPVTIGPTCWKNCGRRPPQTWAEYQELAKLLAAQKPAGSQRLGAARSSRSAPGWAGLVLLARAASYAKHRDNYSALFNIETMEPLVAGPPFVQALDELVAAAKLGPADPLRYDPAAARAAFWKGQCGMALTWPTAANDGVEGAKAESRSLHDQRKRVPTSRSAHSRGLRRVARGIAGLQPQQPRLGQSAG